MASRELDHFIMSVVGTHWQKVAMVIAKALTELSLANSDTEDYAEVVASRIDALIASGYIEVNGNPTKWRHSEVRRASHAAAPPNKLRHAAAFGGWTRHYVARLCGERYVSDANSEVIHVLHS